MPCYYRQTNWIFTKNQISTRESNPCRQINTRWKGRKLKLVNRQNETKPELKSYKITLIYKIGNKFMNMWYFLPNTLNKYISYISETHYKRNKESYILRSMCKITSLYHGQIPTSR